MNRLSSSAARSLLALALLTAASDSLQAAPRPAAVKTPPASPWRLQDTPAARPDRDLFVPTTKYQAFTADLTQVRAILAGAPLDLVTAAARGTVVSGSPVELSLPMPRDGRLARFRVEEVSIMEPGLATKYPDIKTYRGTGIDDPAAQLSLDVTPSGLHAQILSPAGRVYVSPVYFGAVDDLYASYYKSDMTPDPTDSWACRYAPRLRLPTGVATPIALPDPIVTVDDAVAAGVHPANLAPTRVTPPPLTTFGGSLRTYRLACGANHQYVAFTGGTKATALASIVTTINRVSAIYESEVGIRLVLVANDDAIIYPDAATDPYSNDTTNSLNQSQTNCDAVIGNANYDIGHVFTTAGGGLAGLGVVCTTGSKGQGTTGRSSPVGDAFSVDYVAHEMGHQFGANHTFNGGATNGASCEGENRAAAHAYEPGSGSAIMAYAGICGENNNLQQNSDSLFHSESISEILTYAANGGAGCAVVTTNTDSTPTVSAGSSYTLPISTPFTLTGSATDADGDAITYSWEDRDLGQTQTDVTTPDNGNEPLFRTFSPVYSPSRTFPRISDIVNGTTTAGERLPTKARTLNMRLTVRDNRTGGGATNSADQSYTVTAAAGPFTVTAPNSAITVAAGGALAVTWSVGNTNAPPVAATRVSIALSVNGGYTYPYTLAASVSNNGSTTVTLPTGVKTTTARIRVAAVNNVFFNLSPVNFSIQ